MITVEDLAWRAPGAARPLFEDMRWTLPAGALLLLLGPNGSGKSTLLELVAGIRRPIAGRARRAADSVLVPQRSRPAVFTVLDMVVMGRARRLGWFGRPGRVDRAAARAHLERLGIARLADRPFDRLSGGEAQLVLIARALLAEAPILLLDEPTSALDLANQARVLAVLGELRRSGLTLLVATHEPGALLALASHALLLSGRGGWSFGPAATIVDEARLEGLFGTPVQRLGDGPPGPVCFVPRLVT